MRSHDCVPLSRDAHYDSPPALEPDPNRAARIATWSILALNAILLAISLPDYCVSIDSGYHISLAQWYAVHGQAWWDHINFGPGGRPNLQGPALHIAIAILGELLGGTPDRFILANAILGITQWGAAMLTVLYFARRLGGDIAAMFAVAMLAGSAFAAGSSMSELLRGGCSSRFRGRSISFSKSGLWPQPRSRCSDATPISAGF